jgi:succinate dehydrogenase flavin-adding protein (antitoxin of CptAB toxin-antitoxin module)
MGEVINFDFRNKKFISKKGEPASPKEIEKDSRRFLPDNLTNLTSAIMQIKDLPVSQNALQSLLEIVKSYSDEDLFNWLNNSSESDWKSKPAFFRAIAYEFLSRGLSEK